MEDAIFMHRCLELAARGRGKVGINPLVGSVLVREGSIIAEAWHEGFGLAHAERALLERFKGPIEPEDVLYVNLEPCCHRSKTPPCTDFLIERGVKHVVYGMVDPNPHVAGKGIAQLRSAGVDVRGPVLPELAARLNRGFIALHTQGRPWITLKMARTRAGAVSNVDGSLLKITSQEQDAWAHEFLRGTHDAIIIGVGTVLSDDPQLTRRILNKKIDQNSYQPLRIVLDPNFRIPENAKLVTEHAIGTIIVTAQENIIRPKCALLLGRGVKILPVPLKEYLGPLKNSLARHGEPFVRLRAGSVEPWRAADSSQFDKLTVTNRGIIQGFHLFDFAALWKVLTTPAGDFHGISSILVEGGKRTWEAFQEVGAVDEEVILVGN